MANSLAQSLIQGTNIQHDQYDTGKGNTQIQPQLLILEYTPNLLQKQQVVDGEVDTEQEHKDSSHILNIRTVAGNGVISDAKAACTGCTKGSTHCLKQAHTANQQEHNIQRCQYNIN